MKFEKINKDKIKVTINSDDLDKKDIDLHSFMADSDETQSLFLDVLDMAEKDFGFSTKDYNLKVETVALSDGVFILTITRILDKESTGGSDTFLSAPKKQPRANRKKPCISSSIVYKFDSFDDFCAFTSILYENMQINYKRISKDTALYNYQDNYYLIFFNVNTKFQELKKTFSLITEFATYISSSDVFIAKIYENGNFIFKKNALGNCQKYFA